jgi:hypothetical protein
LASAVVLVAGVIALSLLSRPPQLVWLDPSQSSLTAPPQGAWSQLKGRLAILTAPIWHRFRRTKPQIHINTTMLKLGPLAAENAGLGAPAGTNSDGVRAWLLARDQLAGFRQRIMANSDVMLMAGPKVVTLDGRPASVSVGSSSGAGEYSISLNIGLLPKVVSKGVRLQIGASWTDETPRPARRVACLGLVPNGGALVVDAEPARDAKGKGYWFIFSTTEIDAAGNPVK